MKRMFEILDAMNLLDTKNGTRTVSLSNTLVEVRKSNQGTLVTMGADEQTLSDIVSEKARVILCVVDWEAYKQEEQK